MEEDSWHQGTVSSQQKNVFPINLHHSRYSEFEGEEKRWVAYLLSGRISFDTAIARAGAQTNSQFSRAEQLPDTPSQKFYMWTVLQLPTNRWPNSLNSLWPLQHWQGRAALFYNNKNPNSKNVHVNSMACLHLAEVVLLSLTELRLFLTEGMYQFHANIFTRWTEELTLKKKL